MFQQTFDFHDFAIIGMLIVLEGVLSIDNALVLGLLAKRLPGEQQKKALTYGLIGAFTFRLLAIATASYLMHWRWVKLLGGLYLIYVAGKHFLFEESSHPDEKMAVDAQGKPMLVDAETGTPVDPKTALEEIRPESRLLKSAVAKFWPTVFVIELTDIAFAVDSILAAIGVVGEPPAGATRHPKLWVVLTGGFIGVVLIRFAAVMFIRLLNSFPRFETAAYLLVIVIGGKLVAEWGFNTEEHPHVLNFHDWRRFEFWAFWGTMIGSFCVGFLPQKRQQA